MKKEVIMSAFLGLACTGILLSSCSENNDDPSSKPDRTTTDEMYYAISLHGTCWKPIITGTRK